MTNKIPKDHQNRIIKKYIIKNLGIAFIVLSFGIIAMWEYKTTGSVWLKSPKLIGEDAKFLAWSLLTVGIIAVLYCVISLLKTITDPKLRNETIEKLYDSTYVICPKCKKSFLGHEVKNDLKCPNCNVTIEELEGFYERHQLNNTKKQS